MIESLLIVLYTATVFLVFHWLLKNDGKAGIADQTGPFGIAVRHRDEADDRGDRRRSARRRAPATPTPACGTETAAQGNRADDAGSAGAPPGRRSARARLPGRSAPRRHAP